MTLSQGRKFKRLKSKLLICDASKASSEVHKASAASLLSLTTNLQNERFTCQLVLPARLRFINWAWETRGSPEISSLPVLLMMKRQDYALFVARILVKSQSGPNPILLLIFMRNATTTHLKVGPNTPSWWVRWYSDGSRLVGTYFRGRRFTGLNQIVGRKACYRQLFL